MRSGSWPLPAQGCLYAAVVLSTWQAPCSGGDLPPSCADVFYSREAEFAFLSGAPTSLAAGLGREHATNQTEHEQVARIHAPAENQYRACSRLGGRYWEASFATDRYIMALRFEGLPTGVQEYEEHDGGRRGLETPVDVVMQNLRSRLHSLPGVLMSGLCAPAECGDIEIRTLVFRRFLSTMLRLDMDLPPPDPDEFEARELDAWSSLDLDFVIAGAGNCGTTSLRKNLLQHSEVGFTVPGEDQWFWRHDRTLPFKADVEEFNRIWKARGHRAPRIRGLADPGLLTSPHVQQVLARLGGTRVVVVVCDPVGRFEKWFWRHHLCRADRQPLPTAPQKRCWPSLAAALEDNALVAQDLIGDRLLRLQALLGPRLLLLHQDSLRFVPRQSYNNLAAFLGASPFPRNLEFRRHNSQRGHRTELCRSAVVLAALQRRLEPEYQALIQASQEAGVDVPVALRLRRTRCDRQDELTTL